MHLLGFQFRNIQIQYRQIIALHLCFFQVCTFSGLCRHTYPLAVRHHVWKVQPSEVSCVNVGTVDCLEWKDLLSHKACQS